MGGRDLLKEMGMAWKFSSQIRFVTNFYCRQIISCFCQKCSPPSPPTPAPQKWGSLLENYPDFETFVHIIKHSLQGLLLKILKVSQQRQTILRLLPN